MEWRACEERWKRTESDGKKFRREENNGKRVDKLMQWMGMSGLMGK